MRQIRKYKNRKDTSIFKLSTEASKLLKNANIDNQTKSYFLKNLIKISQRNISELFPGSRNKLISNSNSYTLKAKLNKSLERTFDHSDQDPIQILEPQTEVKPTHQKVKKRPSHHNYKINVRSLSPIAAQIRL